MQHLSVLSNLLMEHPDSHPEVVAHMITDLCEAVHISPEAIPYVQTSLLRQAKNIAGGDPLSVSVHRVIGEYVTFWNGEFYLAMSALAVAEEWGFSFRYPRDGKVIGRLACEMVEVAEMSGLPDMKATPRWTYDLYTEVMRLLGGQRVEESFEDVEVSTDLVCLVGPLSDILWHQQETLGEFHGRFSEDPYFIKQAWQTLLWCGRHHTDARGFIQLLSAYSGNYYPLFSILLEEGHMTKELMDALWDVSDDLAGFPPVMIRDCVNMWQKMRGQRECFGKAIGKVMRQRCRTLQYLDVCTRDCANCSLGILRIKYEEVSP